MKKISYIIADISIIGGREKIVLEKAILLSSIGYDISIISYKVKNKQIVEKYPSIKFIDLEYKKITTSSFKEGIKNIFSLKILREKLQIRIDEIKPDIIIGLCDLGMYEYLKLKTDAKRILEIHGCYDYYISIKNSGSCLMLRKLKRKISFYRLKNKLKEYDKVIILSEIDRDKWNLDNIEIIPNFHINKNKIKVRETFEEKIFLSAGRLSHEKGYDLLIEVWKEIIKINKNIKIDIFGEGVEKDKILNLIENNNLKDNIFIHPFTNKLNEKYKKYYGYILPSRYEGFGMVVLESISNGVPVVAFDLISGVNDLITEKEGFLIEKYNCKKMAKKIIELYNNIDIRKKMSKNAIEKSKEFTKDKIMKKWIELFEKI